MSSYYSADELCELGFKSIGENVRISKKTSIYGGEHISLGSNIRIDDFCILSGNISIGNYIHIAAFCALYGGKQGIVMKDFSGLSARVLIYTSTDDYSGESLTNPTIPDKYKKIKTGRVLLEKHVIVGAGTIILPDVVLGEGSSCGAHSLVLKSTDPWTINAGIPVRTIKIRSKKLLELEAIFLKESGEYYEEV